MIEPVTTFHDKEGARLSRWAIKAGMLITETTYDARSGCLDVVVQDLPPAVSVDPERARLEAGDDDDREGMVCT